MRYNNIYSNHFLKIRVFTNSRDILRLIDNLLDFSGSEVSRPKLKIDFYLDEVGPKSIVDGNNFVYHSERNNKNSLTSFFGNKIAMVAVDPRQSIVKASILKYQDSYKERLLYFIFNQPMHFYLASKGIFFLHASVVGKEGNCALITGAQNSGKSTLALVFAQRGFNIFSDDDCFVSSAGNQAQLFPFPTKIGLNDKILEKYPQFRKLCLNNFYYGNKRRLSLQSFAPGHRDSRGCKCKLIIFPKYQANRDIGIRGLSKEEALSRLMKEGCAGFAKKNFQNLFWALYPLTLRANAYELRYNDRHLDMIPDIFEKAFDKNLSH